MESLPRHLGSKDRVHTAKGLRACRCSAHSRGPSSGVTPQGAHPSPTTCQQGDPSPSVPRPHSLYSGRFPSLVSTCLLSVFCWLSLPLKRQALTGEPNTQWVLSKYSLIPVIKMLSVQFSRSDVSNSLRPRGLQHARLPCPSPTPGVYPNTCPSRRWCHPTISSSAVSLSSRLQSLPGSRSFPMSWFFTSGGQRIGVWASASVLPMNIQDWFPLGLTGRISLQSKGLSRIFSSTTVYISDW